MLIDVNANSQIHTRNGTMSVGMTNGGAVTYWGTAKEFYPADDDATKLGTAANRWSVVYAGTGTINTSDANQKIEIVNISDVENRVAVKLKSSMKRFKFKDGKRYHFGTIAQDVKAAFESEGLVAEDYGVFCSDVLEDGTVQLGIRYDELFAFIISAL